MLYKDDGDDKMRFDGLWIKLMTLQWHQFFFPLVLSKHKAKFLVFLIADSILGVSLFGNEAPTDFGNFMRAFITMFRVASGDPWPESAVFYALLTHIARPARRHALPVKATPVRPRGPQSVCRFQGTIFCPLPQECLAECRRPPSPLAGWCSLHPRPRTPTRRTGWAIHTSPAHTRRFLTSTGTARGQMSGALPRPAMRMHMWHPSAHL